MLKLNYLFVFNIFSSYYIDVINFVNKFLHIEII